MCSFSYIGVGDSSTIKNGGVFMGKAKKGKAKKGTVAPAKPVVKKSGKKK